MRVRLHDDPAALLAAADPFFRADPFSANVIAGVAGIARSGVFDGRDNLWAIVEEADGSVVGVAMHTPPHALFVSLMPRQASETLAATLADAGRKLPEVNGASDSAGAFAEAWSAQTGLSSTVVTAMRMYCLGELRPPSGVPGEAVLATAPEDIELIAGWFAAFHAGARAHAPSEDWPRIAERRVAAGQIHLWRDGGTAASLAGVSASTAGVARVGPVYTPEPMRRRGYGAAVTAQATAAALAAGAEHVVLYTDLANPISNSIYQAIGYRPHHDAEERVFA